MASRRDEVRLRNAQFEARRAEDEVDYLERCLVVARQTLEVRNAELARAEAMAAKDN